MKGGISVLRSAAVFIVVLAGCAEPASQLPESLNDPELNSGVGEAAVKPSSPSADESIPNSTLSASAVTQARPLVARYLEVTGIYREEDLDTPEEGEGRLLRSSDETEILKEIRDAEPDARLATLAAMVEAAQRHPAVVKRLDDVTHAVVGLDSAIRSRVIETIVRPRCREATAENEHRAGVRIGIFLQVDDEIPGFTEAAIRVMVETPAAYQAEGRYSGPHRLSVYADRISTEDSLERGRFWATLLRDERLDRNTRRRLDADLLEQLAQAEASQVLPNYEDLWNWFLDRERVIYSSGTFGMDASTVEDREGRCVELFKAAVKENPDVAAGSLAKDQSGRRMGRLIQTYPELFAALPEAVTRQVAEKEKETFLAALEGRYPPETESAEGPGRVSGVGPERSRDRGFPYLRLASEFLSKDERQRLVTAIVEKMKTCEERQLTTLLQRLSAVGTGLTTQQCLAVLELLEPSPFGSEKTEPAVSSSTYRDYVASLPNEAADEVTRWLFERIRGAGKLQSHYRLGLAEAAPGCKPETATVMMKFFCENGGAAVSRSLWQAVTAIAEIVPETDAKPLAEKMMATADEQPDAATSIAQMRLAAVLKSADPQLRYRAFEMVLAKTEYDPEIPGRSYYHTDPKGTLLEYHCAPALAAIVAALPRDEQQRAFEKLMATLTGSHVSREALVVVGGLVAVAADLSADDAERACELLARLNAADPRQHRKMPHHVRQFLAARDPEERPRFIKLLLPSVISGKFRIKTYPATGSDVVGLMAWSAKELSSSGARETLDAMYDLLQAQEKGASTLFFFPFLDRIAAKERESLAQQILRRMQQSTVASHAFVFGQSVARVGRDVSDETREAVADRLLDQFEAKLKDLQARNWSVPREELFHQSYCMPLGELLKTMDHEAAAPLRDRLVVILCQVVYQSDSLPANPEIVTVRGHRKDLASEVAQTLGATPAVMSPKMMDTALYCVASLATEIHPVPLKEIFDSLRGCQGTASPGVGVRLAETCLKNAVSPYRPAMNIGDREKVMSAAAPKIPDQDVLPVYRVCWDTYRRSADSRGASSRVDFGPCLVALGQRLPTEAVWPATQDVLRRWPAETREYHRRFLQQLYATLFGRLPAANRQTVTRLAEQQGLTLQPEPSGSRRPPTAVKRDVSFDDLADAENRSRHLGSFLNTQRYLSLDDRLALVRRLDEKGYLTNSAGASYESNVWYWFIRNVPADTSDAIVAMLAQPDCVGLKQRLLTAALAGQHEGRLRWSGLWELADLFGEDQ